MHGAEIGPARCQQMQLHRKPCEAHSPFSRDNSANVEFLPTTCPCAQIALNSDITAVWSFWDQKRMFSEWEGVLRKLYMSAAALVAGWVSLCRWQACTYMLRPSSHRDMQEAQGTHFSNISCLLLQLLNHSAPPTTHPRAPSVAHQIIMVIVNLVWIGFALDTEPAAEGAAPITDPEAARKN